MQDHIIEKAVESLRAGELVIFPTETVYGLGADACNEEAIHKIYHLKNRPINHPLIVHVAHQEKLADWVKSVSDEAKEWIKLLSPWPVTFVLRKKEHVLDALTGGQSSIAIRVPHHPVAKKLLECFGSGIAAPSANPYGYISPTRLSHISEEWHTKVGTMLDGGSCEIGLESTIIDLTSKPQICRLGFLPSNLVSLMESNGINFSQLSNVKRLPGNVAKHYSPQNQLKVLTFKEIDSFLMQSKKNVTILSFTKPKYFKPIVYWIKMPSTAKEYAYALYHSLRKADRAGNCLILVEKPPLENEWQPIHDRLIRASS